MSVTVNVEKLVIPTYPEPPKEDMPVFAENRVHQRSSGRPYPNKIVLKVDRKNKINKEYTVVRLENEYLSIYVLPEIGGRIYAAKDKTTGYDFFYKQHVIKPALIGTLGSWISGGVEFNWPFHHRASGFMPCDFSIEELEDGGAVCWLSEHDPIDRMKGMVGIVLHPDSAMFETRMCLYNRTPARHSFLWWENAAVPVNEQYRIFFPKDVTYVNFHYLKSRAAYPVAGNCIFNGIDMKEPRDISWHKNTREATSYFASASKYDFFGGYDYGKECGVVHIGNHHLSPGKKMFTWAYGQLATSWENALTDTDGQYAELMAGSYSDNQPDFAWIEPYETKCFSQYWYPITKIGTPCFANLNAAISLERAGDNATLMVQSTHPIKAARIALTDEKGGEFAFTADLMPCAPVSFDLQGLGEYAFIKITADEKTLAEYREERVDEFKVPDPIKDTPSAEELSTVRELYLAGVHVDQYRDPAVYPDGYWLEALRRDPKHIPSLIAMAEYEYRLFKYTSAADYAQRAIDGLTFLNAHPESGRAYYIYALILEAMEQKAKAYDYYYKAAWSGLTYGVAMTRLALLDLNNGDAATALEHSQNALSVGAKNRLAIATRLVALKRLGRQAEAEALAADYLSSDRLDHLVRYISCGENLSQFYSVMDSSPSQTCLDIAYDLESMGELAAAVKLLEGLIAFNANEATAPLLYSLAYFKNKLGEGAEAATIIKKAESASVGDTFPFRAGELKALEQAGQSPLAIELLGDLYYSKRSYEKARECFEAVLDINADNPTVIRNLAMLYFNSGELSALPLTMMKRAAALEPNNEELIYETVVLMDKLSVSPKEKYTFINDRLSVVTRDDILTELAKAYNQADMPEKAIEVLMGHSFVPCEGGEHAIADQYIFAHFNMAHKKLDSGDVEGALELFEKAQILPQNLGAGIWNHTKHIPCRFFAATCLEALGRGAEAEKLYRYIVNTGIEYFSNMHLPELPFYQAMAYDRLGEHIKGVQLITDYYRSWQRALKAKDTGYFATTPFFIPFVDSPERLRTAKFSYLLGLCEKYMGNKDRAKELLTKAADKNSELLFADFYSKAL